MWKVAILASIIASLCSSANGDDKALPVENKNCGDLCSRLDCPKPTKCCPDEILISGDGDCNCCPRCVKRKHLFKFNKGE